MSFTQKIYAHAPLIVQNTMISLYGWHWNKRRFGGIFEEELKGYKEREVYTANQWADYQTKKLQEILLHSYRHVPYYTQRWNALGFNEEKLKTITPSSINALPFLGKDDLRLYGKTTLVATIKEKGGSFFASSGTTGTPTSILFSEDMHRRWSAAYEARVRNWAGVDKHMKRGMIGGRRVVTHANAKPPYYRYNAAEQQIYFSAYHIAPGTVRNYIHALEKYKPDYMVGYAMSNYFLARFIKEQGLHAPQMKAVITSSEKLTDEMRATFKEVYGCKTFDGWSGVEANALVSECGHGSLHISPDVGLIEILDEKGMPVKPGQVGEVVCTGFINYDQPLIRYRIGDYMVMSDKQCNCGRQMPLISDIIGRMEDTVIGKDGREMVRFHGIFTGMDNIIKGQVVQEDINNITLHVMCAHKLTPPEHNILTKKVQSQLGHVNVNIIEQKEIFCGANGKFRAVISKVNRASHK